MKKRLHDLLGFLRGQSRLHVAGVLLGTLFLACSLTPSLLPRPALLQGLVSGVSFALGYAIGALISAAVLFLGVKLPNTGRWLWVRRVAFGLCIGLVLFSLWRSSLWQGRLREIMGIEQEHQLLLLVSGLTAAAVFVVLLVVARLFIWSWRLFSGWLNRYVPIRLSRIVGGALALLVFWTITQGLFSRLVLKSADEYFAFLDALIVENDPIPSRDDQSGSRSSLVSWTSMGRMGRWYVLSGPTASTLTDYFGAQAQQPLRVYVGLNHADTPEARAKLALDELIRVGGFDRGVLLLVTPTGTGWVDPASQDAVEYLHRGNIATVAVQYSYLNSPLALTTQAAYGVETARAVFKEIYGHWRQLPKDRRPRLYLHGLSLGSLNSDQSFDFYDIIDDPFDGALWSGPPFRHESWAAITRERNAGSPAWLPTFRDEKVVRFFNQYTPSQPPDESSPSNDERHFEIVFLQHGSDPIVFFSIDSAWREPDWMKKPRAPDVSPDLRWFPVVTMVQLATDMFTGTAPSGFGHVYSPASYVNAWYSLTEPAGWSEQELERLKQHLTSQ